MTAPTDSAADSALSPQAAQLWDEVVKHLSDGQKQREPWIDEACLQRYLRARHGNIHKAGQLLLSTIAWRKAASVDTLNKSEFGKDLSTGRMYCAGADAEGHALLVTRKRADGISAGEHEQYLRFLIYSLETTCRAMKQGKESWVWLMDMKGYSRANSPPLSVSMKTLHILADHYPERLFKCYFIDAPSVFSYLFMALSPFIDKVTRAKIVFINTQDYAAEIQQYSAAASPEEKAAVQASLRTDDPARSFCNYIAPYAEQYDQEAYDKLLDEVWGPTAAVQRQ